MVAARSGGRGALHGRLVRYRGRFLINGVEVIRRNLELGRGWQREKQNYDQT